MAHIYLQIFPQLELCAIVFLLKFDAKGTYSVDENLTLRP